MRVVVFLLPSSKISASKYNSMHVNSVAFYPVRRFLALEQAFADFVLTLFRRCIVPSLCSRALAPSRSTRLLSSRNLTLAFNQIYRTLNYIFSTVSSQSTHITLDEPLIAFTLSFLSHLHLKPIAVIRTELTVLLRLVRRNTWRNTTVFDVTHLNSQADQFSHSLNSSEV